MYIVIAREQYPSRGFICQTYETLEKAEECAKELCERYPFEDKVVAKIVSTFKPNRAWTKA